MIRTIQARSIVSNVIPKKYMDNKPFPTFPSQGRPKEKKKDKKQIPCSPPVKGE